MGEPLRRYLGRHDRGLLALVTVLSGTAYAAATYDSGDVKNKSLKGKDLKPATLTGKQVGDEKLTGADLDESDLALTRVVARLREDADRTIPRGGAFTDLGSTGSWTQRADEVDEVLGLATISIPAGCLGPRTIYVILARPGAPGLPASPVGVVASGFVQNNVPGAQTATALISGIPLPIQPVDTGQFEPGAETSRSLDVYGLASCGGGSTADPVLTDLDFDVIGHR
jgi:hypothetical protein